MSPYTSQDGQISSLGLEIRVGWNGSLQSNLAPQTHTPLSTLGDIRIQNHQKQAENSKSDKFELEDWYRCGA